MMYMLLTALIMLSASMLLTWWTSSDVRDDSLDLALVSARTRTGKRNDSAGHAGSRMRDWWWGNRGL